MIKVLQAGIQTTVQDSGRYGSQVYGVSTGGAMCSYNHKLANLLVGNEMDLPVLEIVQSPHSFLFEEDCAVSFCGGGLLPDIDFEPLPLFEPVLIRAGTKLSIKNPQPGFRLYMAVAGGFKAEIFLNSYSTYLLIESGGYKGRVLKKEDELENNQPSELSNNIKELLKKNMFFRLPESLRPGTNLKTIRIIAGNEYDLLHNESIKKLSTQKFALTNDYNRMGYRLKSQALSLQEKKEMISTAVTKGTIQLLPDGQLIALMSDCQTVGGYPRIAQIAAADFVYTAQLKPGDEISFQIISLTEAEQLYLAQEERLQQVQEKIRQTFL